MTYDPYRRPPPDDLEPYSAGVVVLGALLLVAIVGFIVTRPSDQKFAPNDLGPPITQQSTTGSSANMPPAPQPRLEPKVKPVE